MHAFNLDGYYSLICCFLEAGYKFTKFEFPPGKYGQVILRHDIDFCIDYALPIAKIEHDLGVTSTFFVLMDNELYNPFTEANKQTLQLIAQMGHSICLHVDEKQVKSDDDFYNSLSAFKSVLPFSDNRIISRHRPNLKSKLSWCSSEVTDAYQPEFFSNIEYASDSRGEWKYGYPTDRLAFANKESFQLLTHPIWWVNEGTNGEKISKMLKERDSAGAKSISYLNII